MPPAIRAQAGGGRGRPLGRGHMGRGGGPTPEGGRVAARAEALAARAARGGVRRQAAGRRGAGQQGDGIVHPTPQQIVAAVANQPRIRIARTPIPDHQRAAVPRGGPRARRATPFPRAGTGTARRARPLIVREPLRPEDVARRLRFNGDDEEIPDQDPQLRYDEAEPEPEADADEIELADVNVDEQAAAFDRYQAERRLRTGRARVQAAQRSTPQPQRQADISFASTAGGNGHNLKKALRNAGLFDITHDETPALRSAWKSIVIDFAADNIGLTGTAVIKALGTFFKDAADREWWAQVSIGIGDLDMFLAQFDQYFEGPKRNRREAINDIIRMRRTTDQMIDRFLLTGNGKIRQLCPPADDDECVDLAYDTLPECLRIGDLETRPSENTDAYTYISICTKLRRIEERVVVQTVRLAEEKARTNSKSLAVNRTLLNVTDPYIRAETLRRGGFTSTATTSDGASGSGKRSAIQQVTIDDDDELADPGSVCISVNNSRSSFSSQSSKP